MRVIAVGVLALGLGLATGAGAQEKRWIEAAGVGRAEPGEVRGGPGYQVALREALLEAVTQAGVALLAAEASGPAPSDDAALAERARQAVGSDPLPYVTRYQIREDRGVQARLLHPDPTAKAEYQLVAMVQVDVARLRGRLGVGRQEVVEEAVVEETPVDTPTLTPVSREVTLRLEDVRSYRDYSAVKEALESRVGARAVVPVAFAHRQAVLRVDSSLPPAELLAALARALRGRLDLAPVTAPVGETSELALRLLPPGSAPAPQAVRPAAPQAAAPATGGPSSAAPATPPGPPSRRPAD